MPFFTILVEENSSNSIWEKASGLRVPPRAERSARCVGTKDGNSCFFLGFCQHFLMEEIALFILFF